MNVVFEVEWEKRADGTFWWWLTLSNGDSYWTSKPAQLFFTTEDEARADIVRQVNKLVKCLGLSKEEVKFG